MSSRLRPIALIAAALVLVAAASAYATTASHRARPAAAEPVVRAVLSEAPNPPGAKGQTLGLTRVTVKPGAALALHRHPGTQASSVARGTLTYWVVRGSVTVKHGEQAVRTIRPGQHGRIPAGDSIVELPGTIHRAANRGTTPVVILIASLFKDGAPPSIPVKP